MAQLHDHSKLPLILWETSELSRAKTVVMREQLDVNETIEFSLAQVIGVWKGDIHQNENQVHDDLPAEVGEITVLMTTTNVVEETITSSAPFHTSWSRGGGLGCRPQSSQNVSKESTPFIPSRSWWSHPV